MQEILKKAEDHMKKTISVLQEDYAAIRAGRANPAVLDKLRVDYYGTPTAINQLAAVSVAEARVLTIQPWDASVCRAIEKAIQTSDIGINPQSDGKIIRITFPQLTEDRRKELAKEISKMAEESKVAVRNVRREAMDKLKLKKKDGELTEDDLKQAEKKTRILRISIAKRSRQSKQRKRKKSWRFKRLWKRHCRRSFRFTWGSSWTATDAGPSVVGCLVPLVMPRGRPTLKKSRSIVLPSASAI